MSRRIDADEKTGGPGIRHFSQSLPMLLLRARESVMRHFRQSLRSFDLTEQQWRVLRALRAVPEMELGELAKITFLLAPSLTRIVRDLEQRRLVARRSHTGDLRRGLMRLTAKGSDLIDTVSPNSERIYAQIALRFDAQKLAMLQTLLIELEAVMLEDLDLPKLERHKSDEKQAVAAPTLSDAAADQRP